MIKHIVIWKLNKDAKNKVIHIKEALEALNGEIPELIKLEVGIDFSKTESSGDLILYSEFASQENLELYQNHPKHKAIVPLIKECICERRMVDYEI